MGLLAVKHVSMGNGMSGTHALHLTPYAVSFKTLISDVSNMYKNKKINVQYAVPVHDFSSCCFYQQERSICD